ncbi:MAG TPA: helix-turn-helix domain-containing protein [Pseudonocardiaceae bacterium]|jgi:DNA-binding transcriptional ArsR family regulator|nr:helix-turn-helix domain-containing protein [Pseudonocardiaceae bacterium]
MASADLLLHPVRLRILKAFLRDRALTTAQLAAELDDVPAGSLYRHVALLTRAGVLAVTAERPVRGTVERTYRLRAEAARIGPDEFAAMGPDEHRTAFMTFVAGLLADFDRYLGRGDVDLVRDGNSYATEALWLDDEEYVDLVGELAAVLDRRRAQPPRPGRRRRLLSAVWLLDDPHPGELHSDELRTDEKGIS